MSLTKGQKGKGNDPMPEEETPYATEGRDARARARAREDSVTESDDPRDDEETFAAMDDVVDLWLQQAKATLLKIGNWPGRNSGFLAEHPASTYDLLAYSKDAPMAGGVPVMVALQRLHCFLVAVPASWCLYALAWILQRPLRSVCFLLFAVVIWRLH